MAKSSAKSVFFCQNCGYESSKWMGQCPSCHEWNTFVEEKVPERKAGSARRNTSGNRPVKLNEVSLESAARTTTGIKELDRVLGGGIVQGSLMLIGGDPGIGKSTLLLQVCRNLAANHKTVLYVSGEESVQQIRMRAERIGEISDSMLLLAVTFFMLRRTKLGRSFYAIGGNAVSAAMMGLNVKKIKLKAYMLSSIFCSIGAICYCLNTMAGSVSQALGLEMDAISSAVIGGTLLTGGVGNVIGSFFGVLINGTISSIVKTNGKLASSWPNILTAALLFLFIVIQSVFAMLRSRKK